MRTYKKLRQKCGEREKELNMTNRVNHSSSTIQMQSVGEEEGGGEYESKSNNLLLSFTVKQKNRSKVQFD